MSLGLHINPLSYFSFHPMLHNWCNKVCCLYLLICEMVNIKRSLAANHVLCNIYILYYIILYYIILYYIILYYIILYYIILYYIILIFVLYCIVLYCVVLYLYLYYYFLNTGDKSDVCRNWVSKSHSTDCDSVWRKR